MNTTEISSAAFGSYAAQIFHSRFHITIFALADEAEVVVHQGSDGENVGGVHSCTHNLQPKIVFHQNLSYINGPEIPEHYQIGSNL